VAAPAACESSEGGDGTMVEVEAGRRGHSSRSARAERRLRVEQWKALRGQRRSRWQQQRRSWA
jgi:hypothetical protein